MQTPSSAPRRGLLGAALLAALFILPGLFFVLAGIGAIPAEPGSTHVPLWIVGLVGAVLVGAGSMLLVAAFGGVTASGGRLPPDAPFALRVARYLLGLLIVGGLAATGSWVALAPGPEHVNDPEAGLGIATFVFGAGAILCWLTFLWLAVRGWRELKESRRPKIHIEQV